MPRSRSTARLSPTEITVNFDDPTVSSEEFLAAMTALGLDLELTPAELDELRARGPELRRWLGRDPSRYEAFTRDPRAALAALDRGMAPASRRRAARPTARWQGVGARGEVAEAGRTVAGWALAEPGRLALLVKNPREAIDAALAGRTPRTRSRLAEAIGLEDQPSAPARGRRSASRRRT